MRFEVVSKDLLVEEQVRLPDATAGRFALYGVRERGATALGILQSAGDWPAAERLYRLGFTLPHGSYATLVIRALSP